jgi:hypothetical protein
VENKPTHITLQDFTTHNGAFMLPKLKFSGFGAPLHTAIILINHFDWKLTSN